MMKITRSTTWFAALMAGSALSWSFNAQSQETERLPDAAIVAERGGATLTVGDLRAKIRLSLIKDKRAGFFADGDRVARLVEDQLTTRQLAAAAKENGLDKDPQLQAEIESYIRGVLARRQIEQHLERVELPDADLLAKERYQANKADFMVPAARDVRHILILTSDKSDEEAKVIADKAYALLQSGEDFDKVLDEYSEDPAIAHNGWVRGVRDDGSFEAEFTAAAIALQNPGDFSSPVKSAFGYHIIRLQQVIPERQKPYDEVKDELIANIQREQLAAAREAYLESFKVLPVQFNDETMKRLPTAEP